MSPTETIITIASSIVSWGIFEVIRKKIEQDQNAAALKSILTVCASVALIGATGGGLYLGYHALRKVTEPPQPEPPPNMPVSQVVSVPTPTPQSTPNPRRVFRSPIRSHQRAQAPAAETAQANNAAPLTPQTSQSPAAAPPAQGQPPQSPATETRPLLAPAQGTGCPVTPVPATIIIPPGEKPSEPDQLV
jgi:hypothetical protein